MAAKSKYTDEVKGAVLRALTLNNGNVKKTAREFGIPPGTVKTWRDTWQHSGVPAKVQEAAEEEAEVFIQDATRARDTALRQWEQKVNDGEVAARDLMTGVGVLTDKINLAKGVSKNNEKPALEPGLVRELAKGLIEGAVSAAQKREKEIEESENDIDEAEYRVIETPALNRGTS